MARPAHGACRTGLRRSTYAPVTSRSGLAELAKATADSTNSASSLANSLGNEVVVMRVLQTLARIVGADEIETDIAALEQTQAESVAPIDDPDGPMRGRESGVGVSVYESPTS